MSIEKLIDKYLKQTKICAETDYAEKKSVRKHNAAADEMNRIAVQIAKNNDETEIQKFSELLNVSENQTNVWVAVDVLKKLQVNSAIKMQALEIIKKIAEGDDVEALGFQIWLKNYENNK